MTGKMIHLSAADHAKCVKFAPSGHHGGLYLCSHVAHAAYSHLDMMEAAFDLVTSKIVLIAIYASLPTLALERKLSPLPTRTALFQ